MKLNLQISELPLQFTERVTKKKRNIKEINHLQNRRMKRTKKKRKVVVEAIIKNLRNIINYEMKVTTNIVKITNIIIITIQVIALKGHLDSQISLQGITKEEVLLLNLNFIRQKMATATVFL